MKKVLIKYFFPILFVPVLFLIFGVGTIKDYGINWDEPYHFMRGQAYLHFFLTGEKDYSTLPKYPRVNSECPSWANNKCDVSPGGATDTLPLKIKGKIYEDAITAQYQHRLFSLWRSTYQHDTYNYNYIIANEGGHPPINDILAALTNTVFYQRLHLVGDLDSHHLYEVLTSFLIVLAVGIATYINYGALPAFVASASLAIYPLFFSESHFNIKDPPLASYYGLTLLFLFFGITRKKWKLVLVSSIFAGLGLGTKLNIAFAPLVVVPWFVYFITTKYLETRKIFLSKSVFAMLILYIPIAMGIVYASWPYLWSDPFRNTMRILDFYRQIGTGTAAEMSSYLIHKWNTYPTLWIIYTTQVPILLLSLGGIIYSVYLTFKRKDSFPLLVLLWLFIPILRVSWPGAGIYGGVRQIMEYVPALALEAGIGTYALLRYTKYKTFISIIILVSMIFSAYEIVRIHPNENVYFNQLIGGLPGAKSKNIPYWGNTYGNAYQQGVDWINKNAIPNARLGLTIATQANIARNSLREDIEYYNGSWSGTKREGEYEIELDYEWPFKYWYSFQYYDRYLDPVYVSSVDGVPLVKVWKNDIEHTKPAFREEINYQPASTLLRKNTANKELWIDMGKDIFLTGLKIWHSNVGCSVQKGGYMALSLDNKNWAKEMDPPDTAQVPPTTAEWKKGNFLFLFPGTKTRYILFDPQMNDTCVFRNMRIQISGLKILP